MEGSGEGGILRFSVCHRAFVRLSCILRLRSAFCANKHKSVDLASTSMSGQVHFSMLILVVAHTLHILIYVPVQTCLVHNYPVEGVSSVTPCRGDRRSEAAGGQESSKR